jgi:hypothetical protein
MANILGVRHTLAEDGCDDVRQEPTFAVALFVEWMHVIGFFRKGR